MAEIIFTEEDRELEARLLEEFEPARLWAQSRLRDMMPAGDWAFLIERTRRAIHIDVHMALVARAVVRAGQSWDFQSGAATAQRLYDDLWQLQYEADEVALERYSQISQSVQRSHGVEFADLLSDITLNPLRAAAMKVLGCENDDHWTRPEFSYAF